MIPVPSSPPSRIPGGLFTWLGVWNLHGLYPGPMLLTLGLMVLQINQLEEPPSADAMKSPSILMRHEMIGEMTLHVVRFCTHRALILFSPMHLGMTGEPLSGDKDLVTGSALPLCWSGCWDWFEGFNRVRSKMIG